MEKLTKENLEVWLKENNWLQTDEAATPDGNQKVYVTPAGEFIYIQFDLEGEYKQMFKRMPVPVQGGQQRRIINLGGGQPGFLG